MSYLQDQRAAWLTKLDHASTDTQAMYQELDAWLGTSPSVFEPYREDVRHGAIDHSPHRWTADYFARQKIFASTNFSAERARHLIEVRGHLRDMGVRGFVPRAAIGVSAEPFDACPRPVALLGFSPSKSLTRILATGDVHQVRAILSLELPDRRRDQAYLRQALRLAQSQLDDVCEPYREDRFIPPIEPGSAPWSVTYFESQLSYLDLNFSEERFFHLLEVRERMPRDVAPDRAARQPFPVPAPTTGRPLGELIKIGLLISVVIGALLAMLFHGRDE